MILSSKYTQSCTKQLIKAAYLPLLASMPFFLLLKEHWREGTCRRFWQYFALPRHEPLFTWMIGGNMCKVFLPWYWHIQDSNHWLSAFNFDHNALNEQNLHCIFLILWGYYHILYGFRYHPVEIADLPRPKWRPPGASNAPQQTATRAVSSGDLPFVISLIFVL